MTNQNNTNNIANKTKVLSYNTFGDLGVQIEMTYNLDDLNFEEEYAQKMKEFNYLASVFKNLGCYCEAKKMAVYFRKQANVSQALSLEKRCDKIYDELPEWAKW